LLGPGRICASITALAPNGEDDSAHQLAPGYPLPICGLRTDAVIAAAPARYKLENLSDLTGKRVGLISRSPKDEPSFIRVLDVFGLKPADVKLTIVKPEEIGP
jgi:hypothetical protein